MSGSARGHVRSRMAFVCGHCWASPYSGPRLRRVRLRHLSRVGGRTGKDRPARRTCTASGWHSPRPRYRLPVGSGGAGRRGTARAGRPIRPARGLVPEPGPRVKFGAFIRSGWPSAWTGRSPGSVGDTADGRHFPPDTCLPGEFAGLPITARGAHTHVHRHKW